MSKSRCYLCAAQDLTPVQGKVRDIPHLGILRCNVCGLVFLENFDHVQSDYYDRVYPEGGHEPDDWQQFLNDCRKDDTRRAEQILPFVLNRRFLDIGCGAGGLLLQIRDRCKTASGVELQSRWRKALETQGVRVHASLDEIKDQSIDVAGLFHVLEHITDPIGFLQTVVKKMAAGGQIVVEVPNADDALLRLYQSRPFSEFTYWSPHLYLFNPYSLGRVFEKAGLKNFSVKQYQRYPLSNHLFWLCKGLPGGHQKWSFLDSPALNQAYAASLGSMGLCDTLFSVISLPAA
jgi:SAM-dependent methyltransferase